MAPAPPGSVRALLEAELGRPVAEVFAKLDPEPIAAASIAQAYRGRLGSGEAVVVKVQRPGIAESVDRDLLVLAELARVAETRTAWGADDHVTDLAGELAGRLREELDFRLEARNATEIAAAMFNDLLQLFFAFGINLPPELSTFFRALVTLEGTLTTLSPGYLVIEAAEQIAAEWARASLAPASLEDLARRELGTQGRPRHEVVGQHPSRVSEFTP